MRLLHAATLCVVLLASGSCGTRTVETIDEATLEEMRLMLDTRECGRNMDDLCFTIVYAVLGYDSAAVFEVPAGTPDSLLCCPVTGLPYEVEMDSIGVVIRCPSGHGTVEEEYY